MYVYVIASSEDGPCKIGESASPPKRRGQFQTGNPKPLSLRHIEPIGSAAGRVEHAVHRALVSKKLGNGTKEWFDLTPVEARIVIRAVSAGVGAVIEEDSTLHDAMTQPILRWLAECENWRIYRDEQDYDDGEELADLVPPPDALRQFARSVRPTSDRFSFNDYLLSWSEGPRIRAAFEQMDRRMPRGSSIGPYLEAEDHLRRSGADGGRKVALLRIEWSAARELSSGETRALGAIWREVAPTHNLAEKLGPDWIEHNVDDVHLYVLNRDRGRSVHRYVVFRHKDFRAVLVPDQLTKLGPVLQTRNVRQLSGFVAPVITGEVWASPFISWLRESKTRYDRSLSKFLEDPSPRFRVPNPNDGPPAAWSRMEYQCISEDSFVWA